MSAWLCSERHIRALVTYALEHCGDAATRDPDAMGAALWAENARSLRYRYGERAAQHFPQLAGLRYQHQAVAIEPLSLIVQCDCYDYQACETPDYRDTPAARVVDAIRSHAALTLGRTVADVRSSLDYDTPPWGLRDHDA